MPNKRRNKRAQPRRKAATRKPDILDVHGIAALLTVSTDTVYELPQSGELLGRNVGKWLTTRNGMMRWVEQSMAAETAHRSARAGHKAALRAIEMGDKTALAKALQSGVVRVKAA
jgi:hypothetical protein